MKKKKLKVAVLIDTWYPFIGGGQIHVEKLTNKLSTECNFTIYHAGSISLLSRLVWSFSVIWKVIKDHKKKHFDLIHAHAFLAGFPGKILSTILDVPVVYTVHGSHSLDLFKLAKTHPKLNIKPPTWKYYLEKVLLTKIHYSQIISVSSNFLDYKNVNKSITVIPNGVDIKEFNKILIKKRKQFSIIFVGKDNQIKGLSYLTKAMTKVKKSFPDIKLIKILGNIKEREKLIKAYKSSHLFVLPSLAEGQPISLLEAWAAKLPVIVTDVGDNSNYIKEGVNGYLVPPADEKALEKTLFKAIKNPRLEELGKAGYNLVKKKYTWEISAEKTLKVYKEVLNGS